MVLHQLSDWDDAYANGSFIAGGERWPAAWVKPARDYRNALKALGRAQLDIGYGPASRNRFDLFLPQGRPAGLLVFVHGGYWLALDKSYWSHLAGGAVENGYAVAMPSYTLCPEIRISGITREAADAIEAAAARVEGPICLAGHSAGGHVVTRMICANSPLSPATLARIRNTVSISGIHDLRPIMRTGMNATLRIDNAEAVSESPALLTPMAGARVTCWVGSAERSEFIRQSRLLANVWTGLGAATQMVAEPDRHHFNVIDGLAQPTHPLMSTLLSP